MYNLIMLCYITISILSTLNTVAGCSGFVGVVPKKARQHVTSEDNNTL